MFEVEAWEIVESPHLFGWVRVWYGKHWWSAWYWVRWSKRHAHPMIRVTWIRGQTDA